MPVTRKIICEVGFTEREHAELERLLYLIRNEDPDESYSHDKQLFGFIEEMLTATYLMGIRGQVMGDTDERGIQLS